MLSRFYGMAVGAEVVVDEKLTNQSIEDLVDAHLGINYAYFGAIDKTLAGFVVLDSHGDDYTLLDVRDSGQVWWQDHETRELELRHETYAAWSARGDGQAETPKLKSRGTRTVSSVELCARYQWLVWLLARPRQQQIDLLVRGGIGRLRHIWPRRELLDRAFERELGELGNDPHLAIYWLLHSTVVADLARRDRVIAVMDRSTDLVRAFAGRLGDLPLAGDVPIVPQFRMRRALVQTYGETELAQEEVPRACLIALEIDPSTSSLAHALQITIGMERNVLAVPEVVAALTRIPDATTGTELVRAVLDKRSGATASKHADVLARLLASSLAQEREPWWLALEALWQVHELAYAGEALHTATIQIAASDRYHRRALQMAMRAAQIANTDAKVIDALEHDLELADQVIAPFQKLVEQPRDWQATVAALPDIASRALAWRVLQRIEVNRPPPELAAWAVQHVAGSDSGIALIAHAFAKMDREIQSGVMGEVARVVDAPEHPLIAILVACVAAPEPATNDYATQLDIKRAKGAALTALAPWLHAPALFDQLMTVIERPASGPLVELFWAKLFSRSEKTYIGDRLVGAQAARAAKAMIATELRHPSIHARNAAGHQLSRFSHPGAEPFLIDALTEYAVRNAAVTEPGGAVLDHGKTENDQLADLVANLYAAVRGSSSPASREALVERLFAERRSYWRLGDAIGAVWSEQLHAHVMALLAERRDARAAGTYAYALHDFVKKVAPLVDVTRLVREWQGDTEVARGFLHYALVVGIEAALAARDYELVRLAHENAASSAEPPIEPDAFARGRTWTNPLDKLAAELVAALSGEAEQQRMALRAAAAKARAANKPNRKIKNAELEQLANARVAQRVLHDAKTGEIWFRDPEGALRYFDGYDIATAFVARAVTYDGMPELADASSIAERALWWDQRAEEFRDAVRIGRHLLLSWGVNNGSFQRYLIGFETIPKAEAAFAQLRANPAPGYTETSPFYVPGMGAVVRTYLAKGEREILFVVDGALSGTELGSDAAAIAEHHKRELAVLATGGVMGTLEWMDSHKRRAELTVREWIGKRTRSDGRSAVWHVEGVQEIARYLAEHGIGMLPLGAARLTATLAPPATPADIAAFAAARTQPVPIVLDNLWRAIGGASWQLGERGMRLLAPLEVLARRPIARAAAEAYLAKLSPASADQMAPLLRSLDIIVEQLDGTPATFIADQPRAEDRFFTQAMPHVNDFWWEASLAWLLATGFLRDIEDAVATATPSVEKLMYGAYALKLVEPQKKKKAVANKKPAAKKKKPAAKKPAVKKRPTKSPKTSKTAKSRANNAKRR